MYRKILIALDFHGDNEEIIETGLLMAKSSAAELFLIHVIEPVVLAAMADTSEIDGQIVELQTHIKTGAKKNLIETGSQLSIPPDNCILREGKATQEIHRAVDAKSIYLLVIGTHGQSGLQLLLGSTANGVLHGSTCDVLAVRVGK